MNLLKSENFLISYSIEDAFSRYFEALTKYFSRRSIPLDESEDLAQEVFYRAARSKKPEVTQAWLFLVARNLVISRWRQQKIRNNVSLTTQDEQSERFGVLEGDYDLVELKTCVKSRSDCLRYFVFGMSYTEIQRLTGKSRPAVKVEIFRERTRLKHDYSG